MNVLSPEVVIPLLLEAAAVLATLLSSITRFISDNDGELTCRTATAQLQVVVI
ncbi:hypothetical protein [Vibrio aestuarianus]|uniref:hypothetical protein n=1 Tax=Vibrio aestuarianus TaxID=28171 RepID=UPI00237CBF6B|nr:hypothetical protein [Vibrio aestuarianus]MDE1338345.1 hypothetical protein [Vibrio aestuarianus]